MAHRGRAPTSIFDRGGAGGAGGAGPGTPGRQRARPAAQHAGRPARPRRPPGRARRCRSRARAAGAPALRRLKRRGAFARGPGPLFCGRDRARAAPRAFATRGAPLWIGVHDAVRFHHRRRGLLARQGARLGGPRSAPAGPRLQGPPAQARPLPQRRSGHDEPLPARRGLRHRRRRRDRSRPRPLRALHRPPLRPATTTSPPAASTSTSSPRSGAATISARRSR